MNDKPSRDDLERQHKEIMESRALRDELLKIEALIEATFAQVTTAFDRCGTSLHLRDSKENLRQLDEALRSGPSHKLKNIQMSMNRKAAYDE